MLRVVSKGDETQVVHVETGEVLPATFVKFEHQHGNVATLTLILVSSGFEVEAEFNAAPTSAKSEAK